MSPQGFFLLMAAICVVSGLLLLAIHRAHRARQSVPVPAAPAAADRAV